jgi:protein disulfide-isomerase
MKPLLRSLAVLAATASFALAGSEGWLTDWEAAKAKSKAENKPILINVTGSDWCGACMQLEKDVFSTAAFKDFAAGKVILMEADLPEKTKLPDALRKQNEALEAKYVVEGFPTVLLLDAEGKKLSADMGDYEGDAAGFLKILKEALAKVPAK